MWLLLLSLAALYWPVWGIPAWDPFVAAKPILDGIIAVTMLAIGSLLPRDEVIQVARRWPTVLGGTAVQYTAMPALAFLAAWAFGFEGAVLVGVMVVGCVPGAMASNVLSLAARANVSYSVPNDPAAAIPPAIYTFGCMLTGTILARLWAEFGAGQGSRSDQAAR